MTTLNKIAGEIVTSGAFAVHSVTDITGFGLLGHAREMAAGSGVSLRIHASQVPLLPGAMDCIRAGYVPGGLKSNRQFVESCVEGDAQVAPDLMTVLYDPQTAGGLLIAVAGSDAEALAAELQKAGVEAAVIGEVVSKEKPLIAVLP